MERSSFTESEIHNMKKAMKKGRLQFVFGATKRMKP